MSESKEDQWMGVTVQSQGPGGKVVVSVEKRSVLRVSWLWAHCSGHQTPASVYLLARNTLL